MTAQVVIPYTDSGCAWRARNLEIVQAAFFPGTVIVSDGGQPFNRSRAINRGVARASSDVVLVCDADSVVAMGQIFEAVRLASEAPGLVYAYTRYCRLSRMRSGIVFSPEQAARERVFVWEMEGAVSQGCVAFQRDWFLSVGGMDEGFEGWGYEDMEFYERAALSAPVRRVSGPLIHLWHPASDGRSEADRDAPTTSQHHANLRRYRETSNFRETYAKGRGK